jgi:hypothetical protein
LLYSNSLYFQDTLLREGLQRFLNQDQIERVEIGDSKTTKKWSDATIAEGSFLKTHGGTSIYNVLHGKKWPLPAARSLDRRTEHIIFAPGIQDDVIQALGTKLQNLAADGLDPHGIGQYCSLVLDDCSIRCVFKIHIV